MNRERENRNQIHTGSKRPQTTSLGLKSRILPHNLPDLLLVRNFILLEQVIRVRLGGGLRVRVVEQVLDTEEDLLDCDCGFPGFFFVEDGEADCA